MRLLLIAAILSLALASPIFLRTPGLTPIADSAPQCITDFWTAVFSHFDLDQPNQLLSCFNEKTAGLYFLKIYEASILVQDAEDRHKIKVHFDWLKLLLVDEALKPVFKCIGQTQDFSNLLDALNVTHHCPVWIGLSKFIYYQANFGKLAAELPQITGALSAKNFTNAGELTASLAANIVDEIHDEGLALIALDGLWNGVHIGLDLSDAQSVFSCWNNDTASVRLEFIYGLAASVANGKWSEAEANTKNWYEQAGNDLLKKIPDSTWQCWAKSADTQSESQKLEIDIMSQEFFQKIADFVHNHQLIYWTLQKGIKDSMAQHNFLHAGSYYAHIWQAATY